MAQPAVIQFEITGANSDVLQRFYADLFGWNMQSTGTPGYARTLARDSGIPGAIGGSWDGGPGHVTVYIEVADLQQALARAEQLGGKVIEMTSQNPVDRVAQWSAEHRAFEVPEAGISFAFIADPEGHVIGLSQGLQHALDQFAARR
jgi:predicted enzyme related to lactoylglutathione lyase